MRILLIRLGVGFFLAVVLGFPWILAAGPAAAEAPGGASLSQQPAAPPAEEKKEEAPTTCGPLLTDTTIPIEEDHASLQVLWAMSVYTANFSQSWRPVSTKGDLFSFNMPVKFTYGPAKNLETYIIAPFIVNWVNNVDRSVAGPNGERSASYAGIGDITTVAKYLLLEEGDTAGGRPGGRGYLAQRPRLPPQPEILAPGGAGGCRRHRGLHFHHRRQPVQMGEALPAVQQHLVEQPHKHL